MCFDCRGREEFARRGLDPDVIDLRYKHYQARLIDTMNRIIEQRRKIKVDEAREQLRHGTASVTNVSIQKPKVNFTARTPSVALP